MAAPELLRSWRRTEGFLLDARAHLSQIAKAKFSDSLGQFDEFIEHNELGIAFDWLASIAHESQRESHRVFELLALAAASMGLNEKQRALDAHLSVLNGEAYETSLHPEDTRPDGQGSQH
jgi:hypothetical protein